MPDPTIAIALLVLVTLVEASPLVRLPIGLLLAIAMLASGAELLPIALIGAAGVMLGRLTLALAARSSGARRPTTNPAVKARREAMQRHLASSPAYARMAFVLAALPGVPSGFIFPLLGAMRVPLWPALVGTLVGRTPVLAITTVVFAWLGRLGDGSDADGALTLGIFAALLLAFRTVGLIDLAHRAETGRFRLRDPDERATRLTTMFGPGMAGPPNDQAGSPADDDSDVVEGELLGEEVDDDDEDLLPPSIPPTGLAPT